MTGKHSKENILFLENLETLQKFALTGIIQAIFHLFASKKALEIKKGCRVVAGRCAVIEVFSDLP